MTILSVRNRVVDGTIGMKDLPYWDPSGETRNVITDSDIADIINQGTHWFLTNDLVLNLRAAPEEVGVNTFNLDIPSISTLNVYWRVANPAGPVREWDYWLPIRFDGADLTYEVLQENKIILKIKQETVDRIRTSKDASSLPTSAKIFGIFVLVLHFKNPDGEEFSKSFGVKITTDAPFTSYPTVEETLDPLGDIENEYTTPVYTFESLFIPSISCSFKYNFYDIDEESYEINSSRDYSGYKLSDIPKYIEISWDKAPIYTPPLVAVSEVSASADAPEGETETIGFISETSEEISAPSGDGTAASDGFVFTFRAGDLSGEVMSTVGLSTGREAESIFGDSGATDRIIGSERFDGFIGGVRVPEVSIPWLKPGYVGYVLLKERFSEEESRWIPVDILVIENREKTKIVDWKIAYYERYRYKVRSIFRYINTYDLSMYKDTDEFLENTSEKFETFEDKLVLGGKETYYYDSRSSKLCELEIVEANPPNPPYNIKIFPNSKNREIFISWNQKNQEKDILGFNVYKKLEVDRFFTKVNSELIEPRNNFWIDKSVEFDKKYIYAIESVDIHGNYSVLSSQYIANIKLQNIDLKVRCEDLPEFYEHQGMKLDGSRDSSIKQKREDNLLFFNERFNIKPNPIYKSVSNDDKFLLKIMSLDTGIIKELKFKLTTETIYHRAEERTEPISLEERVATTPGGQAGLSTSYVGNIFGDFDFSS